MPNDSNVNDNKNKSYIDGFTSVLCRVQHNSTTQESKNVNNVDNTNCNDDDESEQYYSSPTLEELQQNYNDFAFDNVSTQNNNKEESKTTKQNINKEMFAGHRQRARERFLANPSLISDRDILELLLFFLIPRADTKEIAYKLLQKFGYLSKIVCAKNEDITACGVSGEKVKYFVSLIKETAIRILKQNWQEKNCFEDKKAVYDYCFAIFSLLQNEEFHILYLNNNNVLLADKKYGIEKTNKVLLDIKTLLADCIQMQATKAILCHNHPSGDIVPSKDDIDMTDKLVNIFSAIDVKVIEHIIISDTKYFSFVENGLLQK